MAKEKYIEKYIDSPLAWAVKIAGGVAMSFGKGTIQDVGIAIFLASMLEPGVIMARDSVRDIVLKRQGKDLDNQRRASITDQVNKHGR